MEGKVLIIYKSKTGFTEKYGKWIQEELHGDIIPYDKRKTIRFESYGTVIFGSSFYAGMISGVKWLKSKFPELSGKRVIVFATGATPSDNPEVPKAMRKNFTDEEWKKVKTFYLTGGICYEKMGAGDKLLMNLFRKMLKNNKEQQDRYRAMQHSYDLTAREAIVPLLDYCRHV